MQHLFQNLTYKSSFFFSEIFHCYQKKPNYKALEENISLHFSSLYLKIDEPLGANRYQSHKKDVELLSHRDLTNHLQLDSTVIFTMRVNTHFLGALGLFSGDLLLIDRIAKPRHGHIIVGNFNNELCIRRLCIESKKIYLSYGKMSEKDIILNDEYKLGILGIVKHVIHAL